MAAVKNRFWTLLIRREGRLVPEFGSFVRGEAVAKMSELRLKQFVATTLRLSHQIPTSSRSKRTLKP